MGTDAVRFGVIGLGAIGPSHIYAIEHAAGAELTAVCDVREDVARKLGEEHGVPAFTSVDDMLAADVIDAATISTPSGLHLEPGLKALEAGKHVMIEKPLEITTARCDELIAAAARTGAKLAGVFQSRYGATVQKLKALVDDGLLGDIYSGSAYIKRYRPQSYYDSGAWRGTWNMDGGGCLMNQGIHCIDLFAWFMGKIDEVMAIIESFGRDVEVETLALALVKFHSGARGVVEGTTLAYPEYGPFIEMYGSRGTLAFSGGHIRHLDLIDPTPAEAAAREALFTDQEQRIAEAAKKPQKKLPPGTAVGSVNMGHTPVVQDLVQAIREDREPFINGSEARRAVEFITAIYESGRHGNKPIRL